MKLLRKTIRAILAENIERYDKIITMLCSESVQNMKQAIILGEDLGYFTIQDEKTERKIDEDSWDTRTWWGCYLICEPAFHAHFLSKYPQGFGPEENDGVAGYGYAYGYVRADFHNEITMYWPMD